MKKLINQIIDILNKPSDKVNPIVCIAIFIVVSLWSKYTDAKYIIIFGIIGGLIMLIYTVKSIIRHDDITKTQIYVISIFIWICVIIMYCFKSREINFNVIGIIAPILLMLLMATLYARIKKLGNKEKIKQAKIILIFEMTIMIIVLIFFTYISLFK